MKSKIISSVRLSSPGHEHRKNNIISVNKNLLIYVLCAFTSCIFAQKNSTAIAKYQKPDWRLLLSRLDTIQIRSGVLIDKTTSFANLLFYNTDKHNTSSYEHFVQGIGELHNALYKNKLSYFDNS